MTTDHSRSSRVFARFRAIDPFNYGFLVSVYNPDFADTVHEREQGLPRFQNFDPWKRALAICTKPLARQDMLLRHLDRVLGTEGGVHDSLTPAHAGRSRAAQLLRTHDPPLHPHRR